MILGGNRKVLTILTVQCPLNEAEKRDVWAATTPLSVSNFSFLRAEDNLPYSCNKRKQEEEDEECCCRDGWTDGSKQRLPFISTFFQKWLLDVFVLVWVVYVCLVFPVIYIFLFPTFVLFCLFFCSGGVGRSPREKIVSYCVALLS